MRPLSVSACLLVAILAPGRTQPAPPNAVRLTKYILGVADLDRSYAFYHSLGLELDRDTALNKPNPLPDLLLKLVDVPAGTRFRNMMLKIPNTAFVLEVTEFSNLELHPARPRIQDPGASVLLLSVAGVDAALATAKEAGAEVVTTGGSPVTDRYRSGNGRAVHIKDPDGYYIELGQPPNVPAGSRGILRAMFASVVQDFEKAAAFYRDKLGFEARINPWNADEGENLGTPGARLGTADVTIPGTNLFWRFGQLEGVDRRAHTPRIADPGAPAIGLEVRDLDAAVAAVKAAGGSSITQGGSVKLGSGRVGFVRDPSGLLVELAQP